MDSQHLFLSCGQSKVSESMSSGQTLVSHVLEVVVQGVFIDMRKRPSSGTQEHELLVYVGVSPARP